MTVSCRKGLIFGKISGVHCEIFYRKTFNAALQHRFLLGIGVLVATVRPFFNKNNGDIHDGESKSQGGYFGHAR